MVEAGVWMVQVELLSHALFQLAYRLLEPWGWDGFAAINLVSCIAGACSVWVVLQFNKRYLGINPLWPLGLLFSSGLILLCTGHTEYYTQFFAAMLYYGYVSVGYLRGKHSSLHVSIAFSLALWMHLGILFAFPTLLLLPLLKKNWRDYSGIVSGQMFTVAAFIIKNYGAFFGLNVIGLSPGSNYVPIFEDATGEKFYLMFAVGHLLDIVYAWTMRSWIFWPAIGLAVGWLGINSLFTRERIFLLCYTLAFTVFVMVWHPNLGIHQDWDLFALEAAPCMLLLFSYLPTLLDTPWRKTLLLIPIIASITIQYKQIVDEAHFGRRGYGRLIIEPSEEVDCHITLNGHAKRLVNRAIREGYYALKFLDRTHVRTHDFYIVVAPGCETRIELKVGPDQGRGPAPPIGNNPSL